MREQKIKIFLRELALDFQWSQVFAIICLMIFSSLFIYTATWRGGDAIPVEVKKQWLWFAIGSCCYLLTSLMDYNWLCYQSACATKPDLTDEEFLKYKNQVTDSYKYYFNVNYFGNRAPIHIGHHFSKWNKGAYWEAMKEFAKYTCSRPDVRCVTYKEYANWLDQLPKETYEAYRKGQFDMLPKDGTFKEIAKEITMPLVRLDYGNGSFETMTELTDQKKMSVFGLRKVLKVNFETLPKSEISTEDLKNYLSQKYGTQSPKSILIRAALVNQKGSEVSWETYKINNVTALGTGKEQIVGPLEDTAIQPETIDAHNTPD